MKPAPMSHAEVAATLRAIAEHVEQHDSFEGSFEWMLPEPELIPPAWEELPDEAKAWYEPVDLPVGDDTMRVYRLRSDAETSDCLARGSFRVGNLLGQGGVTLIGKL